MIAARGNAGARAVVRRVQASARRGEIAPEHVLALAAADHHPGTSLRPVINATGVLVNTNLGRAPLSESAIAAMELASGSVDLEFDLETGLRGTRGEGARAALLAAVPGAADALVVGNGAAALALSVLALSSGRPVAISRGELVEIGAGFRLPELLTSIGVRLHEVGMTNRTHRGDYVAAIDAGAGLILKVHPSNFTMSGYTAGVPLADLAQLGVPVIMDVGSGLPQRDPRLPNEPDLESCLRDGATIVTASGDKLLGGPQAGLILGDERAVATIRRHPLARALRVDKTTLAALEATLLGPPPPVQQALHVPVAELRRRTEALAARLPVSVPVEVVGAIARVGGGGAPGVELASVALSLPPAYAASLRRGSPALVARVERGRCLVDLRCVPTDLDDLVVDLIAGVEPARLPE